ncbi:hypothetical protein H4S04_000075 [Coemansia sp. S16]|nr:hypothetical protein H4S04_000075 [Coemansia sp. S16]
MSGLEFATKYKPFLKQFGDIHGKDMAGQVELAHAEMVAVFKERGLILTVVSSQTGEMPLDKAWEQLGRDYPLLCDFVGGIAPIFANSGTVESDFSKLNRIAKPHRRSLTVLSLEGSLQAEYYEEMFELGGIVIEVGCKRKFDADAASRFMDKNTREALNIMYGKQQMASTPTRSENSSYRNS